MSIIVLVFSELTLLCLKVYIRLQKLSISISKNAMYSLLSCLGNGHDFTVKKWISSLSPSQVKTAHKFLWQSYNYNVVLYLQIEIDESRNRDLSPALQNNDCQSSSADEESDDDRITEDIK